MEKIYYPGQPFGLPAECEVVLEVVEETASKERATGELRAQDPPEDEALKTIKANEILPKKGRKKLRGERKP